MKWYFIIWLALGQSLGGPFDTLNDCTSELDKVLLSAHREFDYPNPAGVCFQGEEREKSTNS